MAHATRFGIAYEPECSLWPLGRMQVAEGIC